MHTGQPETLDGFTMQNEAFSSWKCGGRTCLLTDVALFAAATGSMREGQFP